MSKAKCTCHLRRRGRLPWLMPRRSGQNLSCLSCSCCIQRRCPGRPYRLQRTESESRCHWSWGSPIGCLVSCLLLCQKQAPEGSYPRSGKVSSCATRSLLSAKLDFETPRQSGIWHPKRRRQGDCTLPEAGSAGSVEVALECLMRERLVPLALSCTSHHIRFRCRPSNVPERDVRTAVQGQAGRHTLSCLLVCIQTS